MTTEATPTPRPAVELDWSTVTLPGISSDSVFLITGGSGAIGYHVAEAVVQMGAKAAITGRNAANIGEVAATISGPGECIGLGGDAAIEADCHRVVEAVLSRWGRLDVLVQCAAMGDSGRGIENVTAEAFDGVFGANVKGTMLMVKAAAPAMKRQGKGKIINTSSIAGIRAASGRSIYGASKAALHHLTRIQATELGPHGINVTCVSPGQTPTRLKTMEDATGGRPEAQPGPGSVARIPLRRRGVLDDYVGPIMFLASDLSDYLTGIDIVVDGGSTVLQ